MVQKVDIPAEHYLLNHSHQLVGNFLKNTLVQFSIKKLLEAGIVSRTLKTGLDFTDGYKYAAARGKLIQFLWQASVKELPHISDEVLGGFGAGENMGYLVRAPGSPTMTILTYYDESVERYARLLQRKARAAGVQVEINVRRNVSSDAMDITISHPRITSNLDYYKAYKALFYIQDFLKIIRTLSRKARFPDDNVKTATRSGRALRRRRENALNNGRTQKFVGNPAQDPREA